jgi:16S rRNA (guanine527-N7)-methyltransferase
MRVSNAGNKQDIRVIDYALEDFLGHASTYGVKPTPLQIEQLRTYVTELLRWNEKINLTAAKGPKDVFLGHVLDSVIPLAHLSGAKRLMDVGPGGGFPGIPIKILRPELFVALIEARRKKAAFIQHIVRRLDLRGIEVIWGRLGDKEVNQRFADLPVDALITRATFSGAQIFRLGLGVLRPGGTILLMKGTMGERELEDLQHEATKQGREVFLVDPYQLPGSKQIRNLVLVG